VGLSDAEALALLAPLCRSYLPWSGAPVRPAAMVPVLDEIALRRPRHVVTVGAGVGVVLVARLLLETGAGRCVAVEEDGDWLRARLADEGLGERTRIVGDVLDAGPRVDVALLAGGVEPLDVLLPWLAPGAAVFVAGGQAEDVRRLDERLGLVAEERAGGVWEVRTP
jgi:hypothetical protein